MYVGKTLKGLFWVGVGVFLLWGGPYTLATNPIHDTTHKYELKMQQVMDATHVEKDEAIAVENLSETKHSALIRAFKQADTTGLFTSEDPGVTFITHDRLQPPEEWVLVEYAGVYMLATVDDIGTTDSGAKEAFEWVLIVGGGVVGVFAMLFGILLAEEGYNERDTPY